MKRIIRSSSAIMGMAVVDKNTFNIPYDIWLDPSGVSRNTKHNLPRVKINVDNELLPFSISDDPKLLVRRKHNIKESQIREFIIKNKDILLKHWNLEVNDKDVLNLLQPR